MVNPLGRQATRVALPTAEQGNRAMGQLENSEAFFRAFETADCEQLTGQVRDWFERAYRTPENSIDVAACVHSAMTAALVSREEECRSKWRPAEADRWKQARVRFDTGMRAFLEAVAASPKPEAYQGESDDKAARAAEQPNPVVGKGWRVPDISSLPKRGRGRPRKVQGYATAPVRKPAPWGHSQPQHA